MDEPAARVAAAVSISQAQYERLRAEQSLPLALFAGLGAVIVAACVWAVVTVETGYQIGYMAIAVGFIVGFAVRLGKGIDKIFGVLGAVLSLIGCALGNVLSLIAFISKQEHLDLLTALSRLDYSKMPEMLAATFSVMDLVFYGIAVYEGYRFSFRRITAEHLNEGRRSSTT
jgi:hypothetical protein